MNLQIKIKKRSQPEWFVWLIIFMPFMFGVLFDFLPVPSALKYSLDISWVALLVLSLININKNNIFISKNIKTLFIWVMSFLLLSLLVYIFNYQSAFYYIMGIRNNFRYYVAFFAFIFFLNRDDVELYLKVFDVLFWINAVVMLIQYFVFDYKQDYLGGLFGTQSGCNGYVNIFFVIITIKSVISYLNRTEKTSYTFAKCLTALLLATFAEIKYYYLEFIIIIAVSVLVTEFSWRKLLLIIAGLTGVVVFINLLIYIFPYFADYISLSVLLESQTERYSSAGTIGRLSTLPTIFKLFLNTFPEKLFGLGLGNCDTSNIDFLNTPFYQQYGYLRYFWFSTAHITLETGIFGLLFYLGFFVLIIALSLLSMKNDKMNKFYWQLSIVTAVCTILVFIYNSSLRTEAAYMMYFIMSLPFALQKEVRGELN